MLSNKKGKVKWNKVRSRGDDLSCIFRESPTCLFYFKLKLKTLFVPDSAEKKMCKGEKNHSLQGETEGAVLERLEGAIENSGTLAWLHALPSTLTNKVASLLVLSLLSI